MDITATVVEAHTRYVACDGYHLTAGQGVTIQVAGETVLDTKCPAGKKLVIVVSIRAELSDE